MSNFNHKEKSADPSLTQAQNSNQLFLKEKYHHPSSLVLNVPEALPLETIYGRAVKNITRFTEQFKGRMLTYQTHGLYIYPAKFIPQIPQFCIRHFSKPGDFILDPFCGSGTTLVEALLLGRNAYGLDINPLAQLISKVKTSPLNLSQLYQECNSLKQSLSNDQNTRPNQNEKIPFFPNLTYWFSPTVLQDLVRLQGYILNVQESRIQNFFLVILASIIREISLADNDQLHPAKTKFSRQKKTLEVSTYDSFSKSLNLRLPIIEKFSQYDFSDVSIELIGEDATRITCPRKIDLVITSPPYVNALDYIRIHKLEAFWTGILFPREMDSLHRKFIGTDRIYKEYYEQLPHFSLNDLNVRLSEIAAFDRKRAGIVAMYFSRMFENLCEVYRHLHSGGHYCIVIGSNNIRNIHIPTPKLLIDYAEELGYRNVTNYSYNIINKRLKIPRASHGGFIKKEWIIVLQKE